MRKFHRFIGSHINIYLCHQIGILLMCPDLKKTTTSFFKTKFHNNVPSEELWYCVTLTSSPTRLVRCKNWKHGIYQINDCNFPSFGFCASRNQSLSYHWSCMEKESFMYFDCFLQCLTRPNIVPLNGTRKKSALKCASIT